MPLQSQGQGKVTFASNSGYTTQSAQRFSIQLNKGDIPVTELASIEEMLQVDTSAFVDVVYPADGNKTVERNVTTLVKVPHT